MPKNSSKSKKDWVSGEDVIARGPSKRVWVIAVLVILCGIAAFLWCRPRPPAIENLVPSGAIAFVRVDHVQEHLAALRSSGFWKGFSKVDVPKLLAHAEVDPKTVDAYNTWRSNLTVTIDHPLFKQLFGREVAVAVYPSERGTDALDWTQYVSGVLVATRIDRKAQIAESLAGIWSPGNRDFSTEQSHYKNAVITAVHLKKRRLTIYYTRLQDVLLFSLNENLVASAVDTAKHKNLSLGQDEDFNAVAKNIYSAPDGIGYVQMPKAVELLNRSLDQWQHLQAGARQEDTDASDEDAQPLEQIQDALGRLEGFKSVGISLMTGRTLRSKLNVVLDLSKMKPETAAMYRCTPTENSTLDFVPQEAVLYQWSNCFDFTVYYHGLEELASQESEDEDSADQPAQPKAPFAALEKTWGFDIEKDLLPILGREAGWFAEGVDVKGLFPVPKLVAFIRISDEKKAGDLLKRIVTTPVTLVQQEDYNGVAIHFVSIPLFVAFKPSYTFMNGYVLISTSDDLLKASIDAAKDATKGLRGQPGYKDLGDKAPKAGNAVLFMDVAKVARQSHALVEWTNQWFSLKIKQAGDDENAARQKLQTLKNDILSKNGELKTAQAHFDALQKEEKDLQKAFDANAVQAEAVNTLGQAGAAAPDGQKPNAPSLEEIKFKKSQVAAIDLEVNGIRREIEDLENQQPDLEDDIDDFEQQKADAENFRYDVDEVVVPLLEGLESFSGSLVHTAYHDNAVEAEMFLKTQ